MSRFAPSIFMTSVVPTCLGDVNFVLHTAAWPATDEATDEAILDYVNRRKASFADSNV